jgi:hypothetical protein
MNDAEIFILWNARTANPQDSRLPAFIAQLQKVDGLPKLVIVLTPLRNGLVKVNVVECSQNEVSCRIFP